jgi:hypothetical protein
MSALNRTTPIPKGYFAVIGCDLFDNSDYPVGDYPTKDEAYGVADTHNKKRRSKMDDVYYVYDDQGQYVHGVDAENINA